jgi:hypothetical protein
MKLVSWIFTTFIAMNATSLWAARIRVTYEGHRHVFSTVGTDDLGEYRAEYLGKGIIRYHYGDKYLDFFPNGNLIKGKGSEGEFTTRYLESGHIEDTFLATKKSYKYNALDELVGGWEPFFGTFELIGREPGFFIYRYTDLESRYFKMTITTDENGVLIKGERPGKGTFDIETHADGSHTFKYRSGEETIYDTRNLLIGGKLQGGVLYKRVYLPHSSEDYTDIFQDSAGRETSRTNFIASKRVSGSDSRGRYRLEFFQERGVRLERRIYENHSIKSRVYSDGGFRFLREEQDHRLVVRGSCSFDLGSPMD